MKLPRIALYAALAALYLLHNDLWLWDEPRLALGLPAGLTYHVSYCLVAAVALAALVRWGWPRGLADDNDAETGDAEDPS